MESMTPRHANDFELPEIDGEILLYHLEKTTTYYLNTQAALIWQMCDGSRKVRDIIELLQGSYPDSCEDIHVDVLRSMEKFIEQGVLTFE